MIYFFIPASGTLGVVLFFIFIAIGANGFTTILIIPWTMLPEVLDEYFIMYRYKSDALFYMFFGLGTKVVIAIYLGITQLVLR
jgi:Na+/melibiose symporter-like transporter